MRSPALRLPFSLGRSTLVVLVALAGCGGASEFNGGTPGASGKSSLPEGAGGAPPDEMNSGGETATSPSSGGSKSEGGGARTGAGGGISAGRDTGATGGSDGATGGSDTKGGQSARGGQGTGGGLGANGGQGAGASGGQGSSSSGGSDTGGVGGASGSSNVAGMTSGGSESGGMGGSGASGGTDNGPDPIPPTWDTLKLVLTGTNPPCTGAACHGTTGGEIGLGFPVMNDAQLWKNLTEHIVEDCYNFPVVTPGYPDMSALLMVLRGPCSENVERMPRGCTDEQGNCVPPEYIAALEQWIFDGAPHP